MDTDDTDQEIAGSAKIALKLEEKTLPLMTLITLIQQAMWSGFAFPITAITRSSRFLCCLYSSVFQRF